MIPNTWEYSNSGNGNTEGKWIVVERVDLRSKQFYGWFLNEGGCSQPPICFYTGSVCNWHKPGR